MRDLSDKFRMQRSLLGWHCFHQDNRDAKVYIFNRTKDYSVKFGDTYTTGLRSFEDAEKLARSYLGCENKK